MDQLLIDLQAKRPLIGEVALKDVLQNFRGLYFRRKISVVLDFGDQKESVVHEEDHFVKVPSCAAFGQVEPFFDPHVLIFVHNFEIDVWLWPAHFLAEDQVGVFLVEGFHQKEEGFVAHDFLHSDLFQIRLFLDYLGLLHIKSLEILALVAGFHFLVYALYAGNQILGDGQLFRAVVDQVEYFLFVGLKNEVALDLGESLRDVELEGVKWLAVDQCVFTIRACDFLVQLAVE